MFKKSLSIIFIFFFSFVFSQENQVITEEFPVFPICKLVPAGTNLQIGKTGNSSVMT